MLYQGFEPFNQPSMPNAPTTLEEAQNTDIHLPALIPATNLNDNEKHHIHEQDDAELWTWDDVTTHTTEPIGPIPFELTTDQDDIDIYCDGRMDAILAWIVEYINTIWESELTFNATTDSCRLEIEGTYGDITEFLTSIGETDDVRSFLERDVENLDILYEFDNTVSDEDIQSAALEEWETIQQDPVVFGRQNDDAVVFIAGERGEVYTFLNRLLRYVQSDFRDDFQEMWKRFIEEEKTLQRYRLDF